MKKPVPFTAQDVPMILNTLRPILAHFSPPLVDLIIREFGHSPFLILISCLLSLRARDVVTIHVCRELFTSIKTPTELLALPLDDLERIIFRTGYYKTKAKTLRAVCQHLIEKHHGTVPATLAELQALPGVGQKTANLVLGPGLPHEKS